MKLWRREGRSSITAVPYAGGVAARARSLLSWGALAAALLGVMLARWTWLLLAPEGAALPPAAWEASEDAGRVFGTAAGPAAAAMAAPANIKLIGVFANRTKGFAIMQVDDKQIGVAQGEDVRPGLRLAETHPDYVVLDQGGVTQRVELSGAPAAPAAPAMPAGALPPGAVAPQFNPPPGGSGRGMPVPPRPAGAPVPPERMQMLERQRMRMGAPR